MSFMVFVITKNGEKQTVVPKHQEAVDLFIAGKEAGDVIDWEPHTINCKSDLEELIEDDISDEDFKRWEWLGEK